MEQSAPRAYGVRQVIEQTGLGRTKVYELIQRGVIGSIRVDSRILVPADALEEFLSRGTAGNDLVPADAFEEFRGRGTADGDLVPADALEEFRGRGAEGSDDAR